MNQPASPSRWSDSYERFLRSLSTNKAALSDLRTGRNKPPEECRRLHRWVAPFVSDSQLDTGRERAVYTVAALYAAHPDTKPAAHGLGASLAQLRHLARFSGAGLESRLIRLCRSSTSQELCRNLPSVVSLIATAGTPISWSALASDIDAWDFRSDQIARRWLRDFFADPSAAEHDGTTDQTTPNEPETNEKE